MVFLKPIITSITYTYSNTKESFVVWPIQLLQTSFHLLTAKFPDYNRVLELVTAHVSTLTVLAHLQSPYSRC